METCEKCLSANLFQMDLAVNGQPARFVHCRACEHRWWTRDAGARVLGLNEVLGA